MDIALMKRLFYFSVAVLFSIILIWFGAKFIFWSEDSFTPAEFFFFGMLLVLGGIFFLSANGLKKDWWVGVLLTLIGFYFFGRASDTIKLPWLAKVLGLASWAAAGILLYVAWPNREAPVKKDEDEKT